MPRLTLLALTLVLAAAGAAQAHDWYSGLTNRFGEFCCGGSDCGPVSDEYVRAVPGGYQVRIPAFDPTGGGGGSRIDAFVANADASPAPRGGEYHLCYWGGRVRCFFFPAPAF